MAIHPGGDNVLVGSFDKKAGNISLHFYYLPEYNVTKLLPHLQLYTSLDISMFLKRC